MARAPFRTISAPYRALVAQAGTLPPQGHINITHVVTVIKSPHRNRVFTRTHNCQVERIALVLAVSNPIVRKHLVPGTTVDAYIGPLDATGGVLNLEIYSNMIRCDLGSRHSPHHRRSVIYIYRLADSLSRQSIAQRIVQSIRSNDLKNIAAIREACAIDRIKVLPNMLFEQPKISVVH